MNLLEQFPGKKPGQILVLLGEAIEALQERVELLETQPQAEDPWAIEIDPEVHAAIQEDSGRQAIGDTVTERKRNAEAKLAVLREEATKLTGDDLRANEAQQRLVKDELRDVMTVAPLPPDETVSVEVTGPDGETEVVLPTVPEDVQAARREFAANVLKMRDYYPDQPELVEAYGKGGPLLFWMTDREFVMSLSKEHRRVMVNDVMEYAPEKAKEMSADILKWKIDDDDSNPQAVATEHIQRMSRG